MEEKEQTISPSAQPVTEEKHTIPSSDLPTKKSRFPLVVAVSIFLVAFFGIIGWISTQSSKSVQQQKKVYHIGVLVGAIPFYSLADSFTNAMTTLGYREGENVVYDLHKLNNDPEEEKKVIQQFVQDKVDLIFTLPTRSAEEAKRATKGTNIPVVFGLAGIEGTDLIESIGKPGGNITGVRVFSPDNTVKRLEILHEIAPTAKRINVIHSNYETVPSNLEALRKAAPGMNMTLVETLVLSVPELNAVLQAREKTADIGIDAIMILPEAMLTGPDATTIVGDFSVKHKIPATTTITSPGTSNILFGYDLNYDEMGMTSANLVNKIFKGTPAGTIPVSSPDPELWINYKVAQVLGIPLSEDILSRAKKVIR